MINDNILKGNWKEVKGALQREWGKLTDDELEKAKGNITELSGTIQRKYGVAQETVREKLNKVLSRFNDREVDTKVRNEIPAEPFEEKETSDRSPRQEKPNAKHRKH